jgi:hypothetical protein
MPKTGLGSNSAGSEAVNLPMVRKMCWPLQREFGSLRLLGLRSVLSGHLPIAWDDLLRVRHLNVYRYAGWAIILVPLLASTQSVFNNHLHIYIPIPVNLLITYFSSFLFLLGALLIDLLCPEIIKIHQNFKTYYEFITNEVENTSRISRNFERQVERVLAELQEKIAGNGAETLTDEHLGPLLEKLLLEVTAKSFLNEAPRVWNDQNGKLFYARVAITVSFIISATMAVYLGFVNAPFGVLRAMV